MALLLVLLRLRPAATRMTAEVSVRSIWTFSPTTPTDLGRQLITTRLGALGIDGRHRICAALDAMANC